MMAGDELVWMAGRPRKGGAYHHPPPDAEHTPCNLKIGPIDPNGIPERGQLMTVAQAQARYAAHPCAWCLPRRTWAGKI